MTNKLQVSIAAIGPILVAFCISGSSVNPADVYLPRLKDKDADVRIAALRELLTSLDSRIPEAMLPLLSDEGNSIRRLAARAVLPEPERAMGHLRTTWVPVFDRYDNLH